MSLAMSQFTQRHTQVMNLSLLLRQTAQQFPHLPGVHHRDQSWSWRELDQRVDALALALQYQGIRPGDKLLVHSRNNVSMFESAWVAFRMGCVWVPTNFRLAPPEVAYLAQSSGAVAMLYEPGFEAHVQAVQTAAPSLRLIVCMGEPRSGELAYEALLKPHLGQTFEPEVVHPDTPLWFFYTSGTTGKPKAGVLTHGQMAFVVTNHLADLIPGTTEQDCSIAPAPLSHGAGIHALLNVARGAATVLMPGERLDPETFWQLVAQYRVSNLFTVPTIVKTLVEHPAVDAYDHSSLRYVIYAGAPMYRADQQLALRKLGRVLVQYFGLGEVTGNITVLRPDQHHEDDAHPQAHVGSCGRPRVGMEVAILNGQGQRLPPGEVGEICCRGPAVFNGYHQNPQASAKALKDGWFHTGDLGRVDDHGFLYITGRESDMYISGGSNVYPREVEEVILTHPAVLEVAVLGLPDAQWGEIGVAVLVCREGMHITHEALLAHLDGRCAKYRWPRQLHVWPALPKSGYGKVVKKDIREQLLMSQSSAR